MHAGCRVIMIPDLTQPDKATFGKLLYRKLDTFGALINMPVEVKKYTQKWKKIGSTKGFHALDKKNRCC